MATVENFQEYAQHCFAVALRTTDGPEEDVALQAFELMTANDYDGILAHAMGVSL